MIYFVRHGQTDWNLEKKLQGLVDIPLNETGKQHARDVRDELVRGGVAFDVVLASPLKRARQTADIINEAYSLPITTVDGLKERDFGEFEGRIKTLHKEWYEDFWNYNKDLHYERAENVQDFVQRVSKQIVKIKDKYAGKNVLIVAHGGVGLGFSAYFSGVPKNGKLLGLLISNGETMKFNTE
jgi:broad specificity phosphatase PhoE